MKLLFAILRVITRKAVALALVATALVLATLVWNWAREQTQISQRLASAQAQAETALQTWRARRAELLQLEQQLNDLRATEPSWLHPVHRLAWQARVSALESAVEASHAARDEAHAAWQAARRGVNEVAQQVDRQWVALRGAVRRTWWQLALVTAVVLAGPALWKVFWYYGLAAVATHRPPARLRRPESPGTLTAGPRGKSLEVPVTAAQPLVARMNWVQQYTPDLAKRTRFMFDWRSPFTSYAAGLAEMTEFSAQGERETGQVLLNAGDDPHAHLLALQLDQHPGVVLKPGSVVAVAGAIRLQPRWHLGSLHHWIAGRVRHIMFCGTGVVYVGGTGGVDLCALTAPVIIEEALVLGYDSRAAFATVRTETFWPYFRDRTSLFDYRFEGGQPAIRQTTATTAVRQGNSFVRTVDAVLNGIGRLLGF